MSPHGLLRLILYLSDLVILSLLLGTISKWFLLQNQAIASSANNSAFQYQMKTFHVLQQMTNKVPPKPFTIITFYPMGRTGNRMFQIASTLGLAAKNKKRACIPANVATHFKCFPGVYNRSESQVNCGGLYHQQTKETPPDLSFNVASFEIQNHTGKEQNIKLKSLLQSWKYFSHINSAVTELFQFSSDYKVIVDNYFHKVQELAIQKLANNISCAFKRKAPPVKASTLMATTSTPFTSKLPSSSKSSSISQAINLGHFKRLLTYICVQVRRTDFVSQYGHLINPVTSDYFRRAMRIFAKTYSHPVFIVVSDDISWCRKHFKDSFQHIHFSEAHTAFEDLAILSNCQHSIITPGSSFGWWGAYLANGHVIYYEDWLTSGRWYNIRFKAEDYFLPRWTKVSREGDS